MCAESETNDFLSPSAHALNVDVVVERILSYFDKYSIRLLKCRLVCHKWNDIIVRRLKETGINQFNQMAFKIPLRYEPHVPQFIDKSGGRRGAGEVLDTVMKTLTGTAARLPFNTLIIDRDFYLAGVMAQFKEFLQLHGEFIHHLKIKIRAEKSPKEKENHVMDCAEVVSMENLRVLFRATPNLKTLNFCVRFSHYEDPDESPRGVGVVEHRCIYPFTPPPQLKDLNRIKIKEPSGVHYSVELLKKLISLTCSSFPSNLKSFKIKPWNGFSNFAHAISAMKPWVQGSLTRLYITNPRIEAKYSLLGTGTMGFFYLYRLSSLTLNKISGDEKYNWIRSLLWACQSSLVILILGQEKLNGGEGEDWNVHVEIGVHEESLFPPVMENLAHLEINLTEFYVREHVRVESYATQFPSLKTLRITGCGEEVWTVDQFDHLLPGDEGESETVEAFFLTGDIAGGNAEIRIVCEVLETFPNALIDLDDIIYD